MDKKPRKRALQTLKAEKLAIKSLRSSVDSSFDEGLGLLLQRTGQIVITGIGKSGYIGQKIAATLTSLGHRASFLHPVEAFHGDLGRVATGDIMLALSYSGETIEVLKLVKYLKKDFDIKIIAITKGKKTSLSKLSDVTISLNVKEEGCPLGVAPMASMTSTLVMGDMIAAALTEPQIFKRNHFARFHPGGGLALSLKSVRDVAIMGKNVPVINVKESVLSALAEMSEKHLGITGVTDNQGKLMGVITDGDIRRFLLSKNFDKNTSVGAVMTLKPKTVSSAATLKDALEIMEKHKVTSLFVLSKDKKLEGLIHIHAIIEGGIIS